MKNRRVAALVAAVVLGALVLLGAYFAHAALDQTATMQAADTAGPLPLQAQEVAYVLPSSRPSAIDIPAHDFSAEDRAFIAALRDRFGPAARDKHAQIKLLEQLMAYLAARYPEAGRGLIAVFLKELFPELAGNLFGQFLKLVRYNQWLLTQRDTLRQMPAASRRAALWQARREAFGADADQIWAAEIRNAKILDSLQALESANGLTAAEKLDRYLAAVTQAYGKDAPRFIETRQTELINGFLETDSIQGDLHAMAPMERAAALRQIRTALGIEGAALQRWDDLDRQRNRAWDAGQQYLQERERILAQFAGEPRAEELARLQDRLFGAEAEVIRNEEAAGFHRYARRRTIGRE